MNILELCLSTGLGGLELYVYHASKNLTNNHNVTAVLLENSKLDKYYNEHSSINCINLKRRNNPVPVLNARKLAKIIEHNEIDLIHMHWGKDLALAALAKFFSKRKPKLVYTRQMMITRYKNDFYHRFLYSQLDLMLTITRQLENLCRKFITTENTIFKTLYYGVKAPDIFLSDNEIQREKVNRGFKKDDFIVGLFGRLEEVKGQHLLISSIAKAKQNNKNIKALIVGHEMIHGYKDTLKELARSHGVIDNIIFNDFVDKPQQLMQICDCICLTTYEETFGLVLPEAMRAGIAVIGSDKGGVPEIIDHKQSGLLFESANDSSLYTQICYYFDNPDIKYSIAIQGKIKADKVFDNDMHYQKLEKYLRSVKAS